MVLGEAVSRDYVNVSLAWLNVLAVRPKGRRYAHGGSDSQLREVKCVPSNERAEVE